MRFSVWTGEQILTFTLGKESFPFFTHDRDIVVMKLEVFARCSHAGDYKTTLSLTNLDDDVVISSEINMPPNETYGGLKKATLAVTTAGLNLDELNFRDQ